MIEIQLKTVWQFLTRVSKILYNSAIVLLEVYSTDLKTYVCTTTIKNIYDSFLITDY